MRFDPENPTHLSRLTRAREAAYKTLQPFREFRIEAMREMVGKHYGHDGASQITPLNVIQLLVSSYSQHLISNNPAFAVSTKYPELVPSAKLFQVGLNEQAVEMNLRQTIEDVVTDAMFGFGVAKVGLTATSDDSQGFLHDAAQPFADHVGTEDWVHDTEASRYEEATFAGNRYRVPLDEVRDNPLYDQRIRSRVVGTSKSNAIVGDAENDRARSIGSGTGGNYDHILHEQVELWDIWLPRDNLLLTMVAGQEFNSCLRIMEWSGPETGPYLFLPYQTIPGNIMPIPPVAGVYDLHILINQLLRKAGRQAERQRTVLGYQDGAADEAERVLNTEDGQGVRMNNPDNVKEFRFGGADGATVAFVMQLRQLASYVGGNMDAIAGLMASSDTVGQDKLLTENASQRLQHMAEKVENFTSALGRAVGSYLWDSDVIRRLSMMIEGTSIEVQRYWGPDERVGKFYHYNVDVVAHSLRRKTPEQKMSMIEQALGQLFLPLMPVLQQQGYALDIRSLLRLWSESRGIPEMMDIVVPVDPAVAQMQQEEQSAPWPASAQRQPVTRGKGRAQVDPFTEGARQMMAEQRSNAAR